jgi:hypothetical protein
VVCSTQPDGGALPRRPDAIAPEPSEAAPAQEAVCQPPLVIETPGLSRVSEKPASANLVETRFTESEKPQVLPPFEVLRGDPPLVRAMRCYVERRPDDAISYLRSYDAENQEILLSLLPLTIRMAEGSLAQTNPQDIAVAVDQLQSLIQALRPHAALVMDKLCFCRQFRKFGVYEALGARPSFRPGELFEVYFEIRNVTCRHATSPQGEYQTHTKTTLEIRERSGAIKVVKPFDKPESFQTAQHDYYDLYRYQVPPNAPPGTYDLIVEVTDAPTGRKVKQKMEFNVRAN